MKSPSKMASDMEWWDMDCGSLLAVGCSVMISIPQCYRQCASV
jgi:hypothetical protein